MLGPRTLKLSPATGASGSCLMPIKNKDSYIVGGSTQGASFIKGELQKNEKLKRVGGISERGKAIGLSSLGCSCVCVFMLTRVFVPARTCMCRCCIAETGPRLSVLITLLFSSPCYRGPSQQRAHIL